MLVAPVSFEGRLEQYIGRLNRDYEGKEAVYVYDYVDSHVRFFDKMYGKRLRTYKRTGFTVWNGNPQTKQITNAIYDSGSGYYKLSTGYSGTIRFDLNGNILGD